ncbi:galactose-specific lectin nattectin [Fundulus heteroclitus]|uniref:galactose-specific lectin nattectin n=1 Tax=Fundulus heteroclitus TaxID=8078 RepID=UPI00165C0BBA|nr:galactose-specific lectin nattectin [Fundulus heteroclitus]XP_021170055.2 galactose-specific lectin nattectin [Fundulus heteroclitus]XP_021170057.2 galactose-specific lectin nattectin [Fundulus heteroclitus]XP_021170058.2 galactose-specific lectin nattectin [Fundulus heteroclitus]
MASGLVFTLLLCLSCALWTGADGVCAPRIPACRCPSGWSQYGQRCFLFFNYQRDWATAERICIAYGANLASFHSYSEYMYLKSLVYTKKRSYAKTWVGGNDAARDGVWMWSDGSKFNYVSWGSREPNNTGGRESCMEINLRGASRHLNDEKCTTRNYFICAKKL